MADIRHVVLLLMENRPFDMYFGFAQKELPGIDGLTGKESNPFDTRHPAGGGERVHEGKASYVCETGSMMSYSIYKADFYGPDAKFPPQGGCPPATMNGYLQENLGNREIMWQFSPSQLPVKTALAAEFAVFDRYFSSHPGPSTPNHLFLQTGTAAGTTETDYPYHCRPGTFPPNESYYPLNGTFPQRTIYESLTAVNRTWAYYYNDTAWNGFMRFFHTDAGKRGMRPYSEFYARAANGTLPSFSVVAPRQGTNRTSGEGPNDDHPCHDVALGERLIKDTYEALRAGRGWNHTLFAVVWDDAGGWYDHVPPPCTGVPAPDDEPSCPDKGFKFDRLGGRVPLLLASPWIPKGTVVHEPAGPVGTKARPHASSQYEHTSLLSTLKHLYDLPHFLTRRDAWAAPYHTVLSLKAPRTDCPTHLPQPPPPHPDADETTHGAVRPPHLTRRQQRRLERFGGLFGIEAPPESYASQEAAETWLETTWKRVADQCDAP
jgi:phospholipase C